MNSGIYIITNVVNEKAYIGSTKDLEGRWKGHKGALQQGKHGNPHLQASWNKYGPKVFKFSVLEYVDNLSDLYLVEQYWMDKYREEGRELYNIALAADNAMRGRVPTKEHRKRIGDANRGRKLPPMSKEHKRKIKNRLNSKEVKQKMSANGRGENSGVNKLTENQVLWIRALVKEGMLQKDVGKLLEVTEPAISMIVHRKRWAWLHG